MWLATTPCMKNMAFVITSVLTLSLTGLSSAETVVAQPPAQVVLQFSQSIPPEKPVARPHQHGTTASGGCCEGMKAQKPQQDMKAGCCCKK
jgi:hypothetical protein